MKHSEEVQIQKYTEQEIEEILYKVFLSNSRIMSEYFLEILLKNSYILTHHFFKHNRQAFLFHQDLDKEESTTKDFFLNGNMITIRYKNIIAARLCVPKEFKIYEKTTKFEILHDRLIYLLIFSFHYGNKLNKTNE